MNWPIQQARARFSEMIVRALKEGPQTITRHGKPVVVLAPVEQYRPIRSTGKSFKAILAAAPLDGIEIRRSRGKVRNLDLAK